MGEVLQSAYGKQTYLLPEEGIYDENGFLFHHGYPRPILDVHRKRLAQHGIILEGKRYSKQEIQTLMRNWEAYRKEYGFSYWSILKLCGKGVSRSERHSKNGDRKKIRAFLEETNFWPRFCADIPGRTSLGIVSLISTVFDFYQDAKLSVDEKLYCEKLYLSTRSYIVVADTMRRSIRDVRSCVKAAKDHKKFSRSERRWLWTSITQAFPAVFQFGVPAESDVIDWGSMESKLLRNSMVLKQQWTIMIEELQAEMSNGRTLDEALDIVAPKCQRVSPLQVAHFIGIIRIEAANDESERIQRVEKIIAPLMIEQGLTGFDSRRYTEFEYLRIMVNRMIWKIRTRVLGPCGLVFSFRALLKVLVEMLRTLPNSDKPHPIRITTKHFLRTIVRLKREHDSTWRPQNKKLRRVISELLPDLI